jgi:hypothetical protein
MYIPITTLRKKKPLKLNVSNKTLQRLVALKINKRHSTLGETLVFLLDYEEKQGNE